MAGGKRAASSDLNHENWDKEDAPEDAGSFKKASDDILQKRVIKRALRRNLPSEDKTTNSIFGNFNAFSKPTISPNPTAAFSFLSEPKKNGVSSGSVEISKEPIVNEKKTNDNDYYAKLKGLNESVAKWIKQQVDENPFINLKPVFDDYEKYFSEIQKEKDTVLNVFSPPSKAVESTSFGKIKEKESEKISFGVVTSSTPSTTSAPTFNFTSSTPKPTFTFGAPQSTATFTFGNNINKKEEITEVPVGNENRAEDDDEPPKVEFTPVVESDHLYTIRCKVFVKKNGNFGDRGVGNLYLKEVADTKKTQLIVRADTNLGNLLCNFILSDSIPTQRMGKKDVMLVCIPTPDAKPPPVPILLRVKSSEEADELLNILEKHKK